MSEVLHRTVAATSDSAARSAAAALVRAWVGREGSTGALLDRIGGVDQAGVNERADSLKKRSIKQHSKVWALDLTIRMMDLTTLEGKDTRGTVRALCAKAMHPEPGDDPIPGVAAERTGRYSGADHVTLD
jgi:deoxyribose-phosphate aldolase